jgi:tetratricopeptide (TPR) repeat protein
MVTNLMKYNPAFLGDEALIQSFVARTSELERILEVLRENTTGSNQHLLVIGPRGIGKTTLVLRTAAEIRADPALGAHWYPIVYGEETYQVSSAGEFWLEALFHLGQQTEDARWRQVHEELLGERNEKRLRARALAQLMDFADEQGKRLVLVVENLNMLFGGQIGDEDAWVLRHTLMNEPRIMLVGTATSRFRVMDEYNQALYELFRIMELEPLADEDAHAVWTAATGQSVPRHQLRPIQILTGGNPRLIRILSEFAAKTSFRSLMDELTRLVDEHTEYFKHHLDNLPPQERKVFVVLADLWDPSTARQVAEVARLEVNVASAQLKRLVDRGAVTTPKMRGRTQFYQVAERMYNIYHLMRRRGQPSSRVHAVVRFMVSLYRDEELVRTARSLAEEAAKLTADQRQEHFVAYEAILTHTREPQLAMKLIEATREAFGGMPDVPSSVLRLIDTTVLLQQHVASPNISTPDGAPAADGDVEGADDVRTLLHIATLRMSKDHFPEALEAFDRALVLEADNALAWMGRGNALGLLGRREEALKSLDRAVALDGESAIAWATRGLALVELDRVEEALASFDRALALNAEIPFAWTSRGIMLGRLGRPEEALDSFDRALAIDVENARSWMYRGMALRELRRVTEALESLDHALKVNPEDAPTWTNRGIALSDAGRVEEALESFDHALDLNPEDGRTWTDRGLALSEVGRVEEALVSFDRGVSLDVLNARAWRGRGSTLGRLGRVGEALESLDRAIALEPENAGAWTNRGAALTKLERIEEALDSLDRALALEPENTTTWMNRGAALIQLDRVEEALDSLDRALALESEDAAVWSNRGAALLMLDRVEEALESIDRALTLNPESAPAWQTRSLALLELGRTGEALDSFERALMLPPSTSLVQVGDASGVLNAMAWALLGQGPREKLAVAENWARRAIDLAPENGSAHHTLACILGAQGVWKQALDEAALFLRDRALLDSDLEHIIDFFIDAAASGHGDEVARVIRTAGADDALEPLLVAMRRLSGEQVDIAREILEISTDVIERIETRHQELRGSDHFE